MKRTWQCPKCQSSAVGYFEKVMDKGAVTHKPRVREIAQTRAAGAFASSTSAGQVEAFICTACGYFEEYVKNPEQIPWDTLEGFRWCSHPTR